MRPPMGFTCKKSGLSVTLKFCLLEAEEEKRFSEKRPVLTFFRD